MMMITTRTMSTWLILSWIVVTIAPSMAWTVGSRSAVVSPICVANNNNNNMNTKPAVLSRNRLERTTVLRMSTDESSAPAPPPPATFREAEILGLRLMQEGNYEQALQVFEAALKLPGSRPDIIRTKVYQTSPVGGGMGGTESQSVLTLDEFELQAVHYNMACAYAQLKNLPQALANLQLALENGFDNFATVRADADLRPLQELPEFETLLKKYEPKGFFFGGGGNNNNNNKAAKSNNAKSGSGNFNPFGLFGNK